MGERGSFVIALAGHVDHGKTTLVQALTGRWLDSSPEEVRRGMTIDLGVVTLDVGGGVVADLIDVPGHEALVHTMVRGAATVDCGLLVVAADDGPMPQTREHLAVLALLGVPALVVALTKAGAVDGEIADMAEMEVAELLAGTAWAAAPIVRVDSLTGQGVECLREQLGVAASRCAARTASEGAPLRIPIDRVFSVKGHGTVVTGTVLSGMLDQTSDLVIEPGGLAVRLRGMQRHGRPADRAKAGDRVALNLADVPTDAVRRGAVVGVAGQLQAVRRLDARLHLLDEASRPLRSGDRLRVHVLAARTIARVRLLEGETLLPGRSALVHLRLEEPVIADPRDRFVIRTLSPAWTVGGGVVLRSPAPRVKGDEPGRVGELMLLERAQPAEAAILTLAGAKNGLGVDELARSLALAPDVVRLVLEGLCREGRVTRVGTVYLDAGAWVRARKRIVEALSILHREKPALRGHYKETIRRRSGLPTKLADSALRSLVREGRINDAGKTCALVGWTPKIDARTHKAADELLAYIRASGMRPVRRGELEDRFYRWPSGTLKCVLALLVEGGSIVSLRGSGEGRGALIEPARLDEAEVVIRERLARRPEGFTLAELRDALGTGRHPAQWLAEHFDAVGVTRRVGDVRVPGSAFLAAAAAPPDGSDA